MKNIIEYVSEYNHDDFINYPVNPIDILILAELSYFELKKFGKIYESRLFEKYNLLDDEQIIKKITSHTIDKDYNTILLNEIFKSNRFIDLKAAFYTDKKSHKDIVQYASMVFQLGNSYIIAFRGTDMSLLGWEEDMNLAFLDKLPSHDMCVKFLKDVMDQLPQGANIYLTGHSKGGNFATFAATFIASNYQERITKIFDFDGPGYKSNIFKCKQFLNIENKYNKLVPYDSIVGTLMIDYSKYKVVSATGANGISQHSPFRWELDDLNDFVYLPKISKTSRAFDLAFNDWLAKRDDKTKQYYTKAIFDFLHKCGIKDLSQLSGDIIPLFKKAMAQQKKLKKEDKKEAYSALFELGRTYLYYRFKRDT